MKTNVFLLIFFLIAVLSCEKNESKEIVFQFTELNGTQLKFDRSSYFILTVDEVAYMAKEKELSQAKEKGEIKSFSPMTRLSFYVYGNKRIINSSDYFSEIYYVEETSFIIILPQLTVFLKENQQIDDIIADYKNVLTLVEQSNNQKHVFKCNIATSEEMITMVNALSKKNGVEWCEPNKLSSFRTFK